MSIFSQIGKGLQDVGKIAVGFATGGPGGAIGAAANIFSPPRPGVSGGINIGGPGGFTVGGGIVLPGGAAGGVAYTNSNPGGFTPAGAGGSCPRGYHLNKHALPASKRHGPAAARSLCVRNRHMNAMNGRAVARAARRIHKGEKLLRRIFTVQGKHHGSIKPKTRKR